MRDALVRKIDTLVLRTHRLHYAAQVLEGRDRRPVEAPIVQVVIIIELERCGSARRSHRSCGP